MPCTRAHPSLPDCNTIASLFPTPVVQVYPQLLAQFLMPHFTPSSLNGTYYCLLPCWDNVHLLQITESVPMCVLAQATTLQLPTTGASTLCALRSPHVRPVPASSSAQRTLCWSLCLEQLPCTCPHCWLLCLEQPCYACSLLVAVLEAAARPVAAADAVVVYELRLRAAGGQVAGARQVGHTRAALEVHAQAGPQRADHGVAPAAGHALWDGKYEQTATRRGLGLRYLD